MSAIGDVGGAFVQNENDDARLRGTARAGELATVRGHVRSAARTNCAAQAILDLMCRMRLDLDELEARTGRATSRAHFEAEWRALEPLAEEGLCALSDAARRRHAERAGSSCATWRWCSTST